MKRLFYSLLVASGLLMASCSEDKDMPEWPWTPDEPEEPDTTVVVNAKPRYVWIDAAANFDDYANSRENIAADLARLKEAGFTDIIVDVRPSEGDVLFSSTVADPLTRIDAWIDGGYVWLERTATWDYLQAFIDEGHDLGLRVNASINTFVGGYLCPYGLGSDGMLFRDGSKKDWATVINAADGLTNTMDLLDDSSDYGAKFLNPANDDVQAFALQMLRDLAKYNLDGIILDRRLVAVTAIEVKGDALGRRGRKDRRPVCSRFEAESPFSERKEAVVMFFERKRQVRGIGIEKKIVGKTPFDLQIKPIGDHFGGHFVAWDAATLLKEVCLRGFLAQSVIGSRNRLGFAVIVKDRGPGRGKDDHRSHGHDSYIDEVAAETAASPRGRER